MAFTIAREAGPTAALGEPIRAGLVTLAGCRAASLFAMTSRRHSASAAASDSRKLVSVATMIGAKLRHP